MARGVDHVQRIGFAVFAPGHSHGLTLDGDPAFALDVHPVEVLRTHLARIDHSRDLEHPICQGGLTVVNVGNDAEIAQAPLSSGRRRNIPKRVSRHV